jgi:outer membrane receptor protein involved in Fe transport
MKAAHSHARSVTGVVLQARSPAALARKEKMISWVRALTFACALGCAASASAQTGPPAPAAEPTEVQEVVVTGSRIATPNATSASPIQVINSREIQATGKTDISDVINQLPQIFNNDLGQDLGNRTSGLTTAGGVSTADLRGLGPNRTLVLIDGRRLGQGSPYTSIASPAPDLDQIPTFLVERIDVLTGGASSVYGSDAIAGVVNFILKKNFQGLQFDTQIGEDWHQQHNSVMHANAAAFGLTPLSGSVQDGRNRTFSAIAGTNFGEDRGNLTGYLTYLHADPVTSGDRDFSQCQLNEVKDPTGAVTGALCSGSSNSNRFTPLSGPNRGTRYAVVGNNFVPWSSVAQSPPAFFNSQPYIFLAREDDRYQAGLLVHDDISEFAKPYLEFSFMNDRTHQQIAPTAAFTTSNPNTGGPYPVSCGNPFLSAQQQGILGCSAAMIAANNVVMVTIGRRNVEGGGRSSDYEHTNYRAVGGIKGEFTKAWTYDAYGQFFYTTFFNSNEKYFNFANIDNSLQVTGTRANPTCVSGGTCVPWNIFQDGGVTPAALNYLYLNGTGAGNTTLRTVHGDITGELAEYGIKSPLANEGLGVNFGVEHRNENVQFAPDSGELSGQLSGFGGASVAINNTLSVDEEFIELRAPLAQDKTLAKDLVFGTGFRHSNYSVSGGVNTYKFDLQFAPVEDLRFRGSWQRAIRAPSIIELFNPQLLGLAQFGNDPCAPPATASLAQCLHTVPASQQAAFTAAYGNGTTTNFIPQAIAGQLNQLQGGNPQLLPEKAKSYTFGFLFSPHFAPNLSGSVDFWQIKLDGAVGPIPAAFAMTQCLQTANPTYCALIVRTSTDFSLQGATVPTGGYIVQTNVNIASTLTSGLDLQTSYRVPLGHAGTLAWGLNGAYLLHATTTPMPGGQTYDCAGLFGLTCQTVNPRWRHNLRTTWETPWNADVSLNWRFIGKVGNDNNDANPALAGGAYQAYDFGVRQLPNMNYVDLSFGWHHWKGVDIRGGINNLLDKDPPLVPVAIQPGGAPNTYSTYEALGRQLYLAATAKF